MFSKRKDNKIIKKNDFESRKLVNRKNINFQFH